MGKYTVKRIINMIPLLFVISIIIFLFIHLIPGDPARQIAGPTATIGEVDEIRNQLGLNQPLVPQYIKWITGIFTGNLGVSYANKTTVIESWKGYILPSIAMGAGIMCILARVTRSSMIENLGKDYIRTARAKGLPEHRVIMRHAVKNSSIDVITVTALQIGALIAGSVVVESVFSIPGLGRLLVDSIGFRDYEVVQALILFFSLEYMVINLLADILYGIINPRVRYE